jgi:hypothetical protein
MFTPPPSPGPLPMDFGEKQPVQSHSSSRPVVPVESEKQRLGRRIKWAAIATPAILILIALSTRFITHPSGFDFLAGQDHPRLQAESLWRRSTEWHLQHKRQSASSVGSAAPSGSSVSNSPTTTLSPTSQPLPSVPSSPPVLPTPFPQPWDASMGQNFSSGSCFQFFTNMTNTLPFRACRPFSLLLQSSSAVVEAQKNLTLLNSIVWGTCQTTIPAEQCSANMAWFANQLKTACATDLLDRNANAVDALAGLQAYDVMRQAGCAADPNTNTYCYINAVHNSNPSDMYYYNIPIGISLPKSSVPTCSSCTRNLMSLYYDALNTQGAALLPELAKSYPDASVMTSKSCGASFSKSAQGSGALSSRTISIPLMSLLIIFSWILVTWS